MLYLSLRERTDDLELNAIAYAFKDIFAERLFYKRMTDEDIDSFLNEHVESIKRKVAWLQKYIIP